MKFEQIINKTKEELSNDVLNNKISEWADYSDRDKDPHGHGKRIPYIGWYWRSTDFVGKRISIGDSDGLIGVMENNKWDYPERYMTKLEVDTFIEYLERALTEYGKGGEMSQLKKDAEKVFEELWDWFQTLEV